MSKKIDLIISMYSQLRISGITAQPTPQHEQGALIRLEEMMAELEDNYGVCVGYNFEETPNVNSDSGVKLSVNHMIATNLATRLIPDFNKVVPQALSLQASQSISALMGVIAAEKLRQVQAPSRMPVGSGHRYRQRYQRYNTPEDKAPNVCATNKLTVGDINDYEKKYHNYLHDDLISSYTIAVSNGLKLISSAIGENVSSIVYRIEALQTDKSHQHVIITITTDTGRINQSVIDFDISPIDSTAAAQVDQTGAGLLGSSQFGTTTLGG